MNLIYRMHNEITTNKSLAKLISILNTKDANGDFRDATVKIIGKDEITLFLLKKNIEDRLRVTDSPMYLESKINVMEYRDGEAIPSNHNVMTERILNTFELDYKDTLDTNKYRYYFNPFTSGILQGIVVEPVLNRPLTKEESYTHLDIFIKNQVINLKYFYDNIDSLPSVLGNTNSNIISDYLDNNFIPLIVEPVTLVNTPFNSVKTLIYQNYQILKTSLLANIKNGEDVTIKQAVSILKNSEALNFKDIKIYDNSYTIYFLPQFVVDFIMNKNLGEYNYSDIIYHISKGGK